MITLGNNAVVLQSSLHRNPFVPYFHTFNTQIGTNITIVSKNITILGTNFTIEIPHSSDFETNQ